MKNLRRCLKGRAAQGKRLLKVYCTYCWQRNEVVSVCTALGEMTATTSTILFQRVNPAWYGLVCAIVLVVQVRVEDGEWAAWSESVPKTQLEPHRIVSSDVVITTTDTVR